MSQSKRKWKVYTSNELRDRFQPKPNADKDEKVNVPNLNKRRNSAPPGMIHFPPGTFTASANNNNLSLSPRNNLLSSSPSSPQLSTHVTAPASSNYVPQQHPLITHAKTSGKPSFSGSPYPPPRIDKRRSSLPHILNPPPPQYSSPPPRASDVPSIEHYFQHLQNLPQPIDFNNADKNTRSNFAEEVKAFLCTTSVERQILPSFQALLQTIREEREEDDEELNHYHMNRVNGEDDGYIEIDLRDEEDNSVPPPSSLSTRQSMEISQILSNK